MTIETMFNGNELVIFLTGRMDTTTSPILDAELKKHIDNIDKLTLDFKNLEYISSAGLRVILSAKKTLDKKGEMIIRNVNKIISEIFEITGFSDILTIE